MTSRGFKGLQCFGDGRKGSNDLRISPAMKTLLTNAHLISPDLDQPNSYVLFDDGEEGKILATGKMATVPEVGSGDDCVCVDLGGRFLLPGFIDIHSHGADGRDVCDNELASLEHIAQKKLAEGVTTWLPTTLTQPRDRLRKIVATCARFQAEEKFTRCPGLHIEGPFINASKAGAQNPEFVREPDLAELKKLSEICPVSIISIAPDVNGAMEFIKEATKMGVTCSAAHTDADSAQIFEAREAGLTQMTHFANAMNGLHHREIGAVGAGLLDDGLMLELITDTIHLSPDMVKLLVKLVPIERLLVITDSTASSWLKDGEIQLGGLEVIVKDGEARLKENGALAGSSVKYNEALRHFVECGELALDQAVKATSWNQAQSLGLEGFGRVELGYHADLVILEEDFSVWKTFVGGIEKPL